jgi:hypothetical protein
MTQEESGDKFASLEEANKENKKLQLELAEKTQLYYDLLYARKYEKRIYYMGLGTGIASSLAGLIYNNLLYVIVGVGVAITAVTGLREAR